MDLLTLARLMPGMAKAAEPGGQFDAIGQEWRGLRDDIRALTAAIDTLRRTVGNGAASTVDAVEGVRAEVTELRQQLADYHDKAGHGAPAATGDATQ